MKLDKLKVQQLTGKVIEYVVKNGAVVDHSFISLIMKEGMNAGLTDTEITMYLKAAKLFPAPGKGRKGANSKSLFDIVSTKDMKKYVLQIPDSSILCE